MSIECVVSGPLDLRSGDRNLPRSWLCCLLGYGLLFERQPDGAAYVSLGPSKWAALAWPLTKRIIDGASFYLLNASASPQFVYCSSSDGSQWKGIPASIRAPLDAPNSAPAVSWMRTGPTQPLVEFALREGVRLLKEHFVSLCTELKVAVVKLPGQSSLTVRSYASALVNHVFPGESPSTRQRILDILLGTRGKEVVAGSKASLVLDALTTIAPEDSCELVWPLVDPDPFFCEAFVPVCPPTHSPR